MSAVAEIQAAVNKLTELKKRSPGNWSWRVSETRRWSLIGADSGEVARLGDDDDADLIVTLHRTIDAQLAILTDAGARMAVEQNQAGIELHYRHALNLARAINGGTN